MSKGEIIPEMVDTTIDTMHGKAKYVRTEFEDAEGNFYDDYFSSDGYYLIHDGNKHHVYKVGGLV